MNAPRDPTSPWYSTPTTARKRKPVNLTLEPETLDQLDELAADAESSRSQVVEDLVGKAHKKRRRK